MKRDMDLIRTILLKIEEAPGPLDIIDLPIDESTLEHHFLLLQQAGLIQPSEMDVRSSPSGAVLTWQGHDFLDAARDPSRWKRVQKASAKVGSVSFDVLVAALKMLADEAIKKYLLP